MRSINLAIATATLAASVAACTTTDDSYYQPNYGYSQGYAYPAGYYPARSNYYGPDYSYYPPPRYGYATPYNSGGPGITISANFPRGTVP